MNEIDPKYYKWFIIPGFSFYEINIDTKEVRSNKHWKSDSHHIIKASSENSRYKFVLTDDYGKKQTKNAEELYELTFNSGHKLQFRPELWQSMGGMTKFNRNQPVGMNFSQFVIQAEPKLIKPFKFL